MRKLKRRDLLRTYFAHNLYFSVQKMLYQTFYEVPLQFLVLDPNEENVDQVLIIFSLFANNLSMGPTFLY